MSDAQVLRAAARKVGFQLAAVCAALVVMVSGLAFALIGRHYNSGSVAAEPVGDNDMLVLNGVVVAGLIGVVIAGAVGWLAAAHAVRPLGRALQLQRQFVADAGHELRTPLTVLHTRVQLLYRRLPADSPQRSIAEQLLADSRVLGEIVEELVDSAQLQTAPTAFEDFDVAPFLADIVSSLIVLADDAGVTLTAAAAPGLRLAGSRVALRRALVALTDNALSHTPRGGSVTLACTAAGSEILLTVADTGEGVAEVDRVRLTARFARGSETVATLGRRRFGLGLALVGDIATAHGGRFELAGERGEGAVATLVLPAPS